MECWPVDRLDSGFQHKKVAWPASIKSTQTDFPRKHQRLRSSLGSLEYPRLSLYEEFRPINGDLAADLVGIPARDNNDKYPHDSAAKTITPIELESMSKSIPEQYDDLSPIIDTFQTSLSGHSPEFSPIANMSHPEKNSSPHRHSTSRDHSPETYCEMDQNVIPIPLIPPGPGPGPPNRMLSVPSTPVVETAFEEHQEHGRFKIGREWQKIHRLRESTWSQRSKIHELRSTLRQKQYEKSAADDKFLQYFRMQNLELPQGNERNLMAKKTIEHLARDCEKARDEYGPLEDDCNWLEDQLGRDEFELSRLEERLFNQVTNPQHFRFEETMSDTDSVMASAYSDSDMGWDPHHPLVSKFLSKMGDVGILEERLTYHIEEKHFLEGEKESRQLVGLDLASEDQETLDNFHDASSKLTRQIKEAREQAQILKEECLREGLVDQNGTPTDFEKLERQTFMDDVDAGSEKSEFVRFPALIPLPGIQEVKFYDSAPKAEEMSNTAGDHINQWLLHQLRSSPLEVNMLVRIFEAMFGRIEDEHWQIDVITFWYVDGARKGASKYRVYSSGIATQAFQNSQLVSPEGSVSEDADHHSPGIFHSTHDSLQPLNLFS